MDDDILEQRTRPVHRLIDIIKKIPRPNRAAVAVVILGVLAADLILLGARSAKLPLAATVTDSTESARPLPAMGKLDGRGPYVVYAVESGVNEKSLIYAVDLSRQTATNFRVPEFLGEYPGYVTSFAGSQGQAAGNAVPINTAEETADATRATRLWLLRRGETAKKLLSTFDFVSAYALDRQGQALAISRRSVTSPARGAFLWLSPVEPVGSRRVGSLRRMDGSIPASELRPVGWSADRKSILATPFCDQCSETMLTGLFEISLADGTVRKIPSTRDRSVFNPAFSSDGNRLAFEEIVRRDGCELRERCEEHRLVALDLRSGGLRVLAASPELSFRSPAISLDGSVIAYASGRAGEIAWRSFDTGKFLGSIDVSPAEDITPVAWLDSHRFVVEGRTSSARPDGGSEGSLFRITRSVLGDGSESAASLDVIATDTTAIYLGWLR